MTFAGVTDSAASLYNPTAVCPQCRAQARINGDECLSCLLGLGMQVGDSTDGESLENLLAEIQIRDTEWRLGNYQILEEIGRGGMGVIYRARQRHSRRIVALKRVLSYHGDSRETLERFRREAQAAASLDHTNILPIYDVGEADGLPFFTMKYATGGTLQQAAPLLREDPRECVRLLAKVARAVSHAHRAGILHRDLKPGNILLDGRGEPMVSDFGLAKWIDANSDLTRSLAIFGTPGFIAPEQASGERDPLTPSADIYSLGAILFDLLGGRPPFLGEHALAVIRRAADTAAPKLRSLDRSLDRDLETICSKSLEREASARYKSAGDLAEDLERWLEGRPIIARPVLLPARVWRWSKRAPVLAGAALTVLLLTGLILGNELSRKRLSETLRQDQAARHSLAVFPILDLDHAAIDRSFAPALTQPLGSRMGELGPSRVVPLVSDDALILGVQGESSLILRAARASNSRAILAATKRMAGERLRIALRVFDGGSGDLIERQIINFPPGADAKLEDLARAVSPLIYSALDKADLSKLKLIESDPAMKDARARELVLSGRNLLDRRNPADTRHAIECFRKAIAAQPQSAMAHTSLALGLTILIHFSNDPDNLSSAARSVETALHLNPDLGQAHWVKAAILHYSGASSEALEELFAAYELADLPPRAANIAGDILRSVGRPDQAMRWHRIAARSETNPRENDFSLGDCWLDLADDARAESDYRRASELFPYMPEGWWGLCRLALLQGDFASASAIFAQNLTHFHESLVSAQGEAEIAFFSRNFARAESLYQALAESDSNGGGSFDGAMSYQSALGRLRLERGDHEGGGAALHAALAYELGNLTSSPHNPQTLYRLSSIEASLGEVARSLSYLRSAVEEGWLDYRSLKLDPRFDSIRDARDYEQLLDAIVTRVTTLRNTATAR